MGIRISAVIPTFNRSAYLRRAIQSLAEQTLPRDEYEIIVVDNCSTDDTRQIVLEEFPYISNMRYLFEPALGANQARNTGWRATRSEYVAFLDDDVIVPSHWLEKILYVFEMIHPRPGCVGGIVRPIWEARRPAWLSDDMLVDLSLIDWGPARFLDHGQGLVSANIAFPRSVLDDVRGFRAGFDRMGTKLQSNGEILFQYELEELGYRRFYHPEISVEHHVTAGRLTPAWFARRAFWQGVSDAYVDIYWHAPSLWTRLHHGLFHARLFLLSYHYLSGAVLPAHDARQLHYKRLAFNRLGLMVGWLGFLGGRRSLYRADSGRVIPRSHAQ